MESPPTHTRTGSLVLATHTFGGGVVGLGLGLFVTAADWSSGLAAPAPPSPRPRRTTAAATAAATTSSTTSSSRRRRPRRLRRRRSRWERDAYVVYLPFCMDPGTSRRVYR